MRRAIVPWIVTGEAREAVRDFKIQRRDDNEIVD